MRMNIFLFVTGFIAGVLLGGALTGHLLLDPLPAPAPAKYPLTRSPGPVFPAPDAIDGSRKLFRIVCMSEAEKDCATPIDEPPVWWLEVGALLWWIKKERKKK